MALFFLKSTEPHNLKDAPVGEAYLTKDEALLKRGKEVFADNCARCHSSKLPEPAPGLDPGGCSGEDYLNCWNKYWAWTKTPEFKAKMREIVLAPDFLTNNFLSAEHRVPVTLLQTNACSPLATNAIRGNIWDNFSSETYKRLPRVGTITGYNPLTGRPNNQAARWRSRITRPHPDQPVVDSAVPVETTASAGSTPVPRSGPHGVIPGSIEQMLLLKLATPTTTRESATRFRDGLTRTTVTFI